jgi:hypothetical protein
MFTDEQMLEIRLKTATPCHFLAGPPRVHRDATVITKRRRIMRSDMSHIRGSGPESPCHEAPPKMAVLTGGLYTILT